MSPRSHVVFFHIDFDLLTREETGVRNENVCESRGEEAVRHGGVEAKLSSQFCNKASE